jgi:ZIP family zinc transporter
LDWLIEPVLLSLIAGLGTGLGGVAVLLLGSVSDRVVSFSMGLASGVMLLVSFNNLFLEAAGMLTHLELMCMFSLGALAIMALDLSIPHIELTTREKNSANTKLRARRSGMLIAAGMILHNLPEGFVVPAGYAFMPRLGLIIAIAIMLHNIPEGVATAIPFRIAGIKPRRIALLTFLSGMAEPAAALIGVMVLSSFGTESIVGFSLAFAAGVMTYITADELIPVAHEYGHRHTVSVALLFGIILALLVDVMFG